MTCARVVVRGAALLSLAARLCIAQGAVGGMVFDSLRTMAPMKGATVVLVEVAAYATTDGRGRFEFQGPIPAGKYTISFLHPALDSLLVSAEILPVEVPAKGRADVRLSTPSPREFVRRVCRAAADSATGLIIGHVRDVDDSTALGAAIIRTRWSEFEFSPQGVKRFLRESATKADAAGAYVLCGVPADLRMDVKATFDSLSTGAVPIFLDRLLVQRLDFAISRRAGGTATVAGGVRSPQGRAAGGALVGVFGTELSAIAGDDGRFAIAGVPLGTQVLEARLIGARPVTIAVDVPSGGTANTEIALDKAVTALPTVSILGKKPNRADRNGFSERRRAGMGFYMGEEELKKLGDSDLESVLARAPGLSSRWGRAGRYYTMRGNAGGPCVPMYNVDGMPWFAMDLGSSGGSNALKDLSSFYRASDIRAIEVYRGLGSMPQQFDRGTGCGVVVIWTK
jgi:hypothetical protein